MRFEPIPTRCRMSFSAIVSFALFVALLQMFSNGVSGQSINPQRGTQPGSSYAVSDIETINMTNGNLMLRFPLAQLPGGRGGLAGGISLQYDSKIYDAYKQIATVCLPLGDPFCQEAVVAKNILDFSQDGGWHYNIGYEFRQNVRSDEYLQGGVPQCQNPAVVPGGLDNNVTVAHNFRYKIKFPDGSVHELRPVLPASFLNYNEPSGYSNINMFGRRRYCRPLDPSPTSDWIDDEAPFITTGMTYYTIDGTYAKVEVSPTGAWELTFGDGRRVTNAFPQPQRIFDKNDNYIDVNTVGEPAWPYESSEVMVDQLGRSVSIETISATEHKITTKGVNGATLEWKVLWKTIQANKTTACLRVGSK